MPPKLRTSRRNATTGKIIKQKASNRRYQQDARAGRTKAKQAARAALIASLAEQAEQEIKGITCAKGNAKVIKRQIREVIQQVQNGGKPPTDANVFDEACTTCCGRNKDCKRECKKTIKKIFPTTKELIEKKNGKKVYESVFSDEDDLQLKF